jgi:hypothetical protein
MDVAEEVKDLAQEVRELGRRLEGGMADIRADLAGFRGEVKNDLRWIKGIGAALLAGSGWVLWNAATATAEVRHQGMRLEKLEERQESPASPLPAPSHAPGSTPKAGG